jgi:hypothetical protein
MGACEWAGGANQSGAAPHHSPAAAALNTCTGSEGKYSGSLRWSVVNCSGGPTWVRSDCTTNPYPKEIRHRKYTPGGRLDQSRRSDRLHPGIGPSRHTSDGYRA